jgi:hypothetical protein
LLSACKEKNSRDTVSNARDIEEHARKFMSNNVLEKSGFKHIRDAEFVMLVEGETRYILNCMEHLIVKFKGNTPRRTFKTREGQETGEKNIHYSLFRYNENTIAVFDESRKTVFLFDNDLKKDLNNDIINDIINDVNNDINNDIKNDINDTGEIKITAKFEDMTRMGKNIVAIYSSLEENLFALLDDNFRVVRTTVKSNKMLPFKGVYKEHLNKGFFLEGNLVSHSYSMFLYKTCRVYLFNVESGKFVSTLNWEQPFSPSAQSVAKRENCYYLNHIGKYGSYYVVQTSYSKAHLDKLRQHEFRIFDEAGALRYKDDFPRRIMAVSKETPDSKLYFMDDDEGISYIDIDEFMMIRH